MEAIKSVFSGFQVNIDRESVSRLMEINEDSDSYDEICHIYDEIKDEAIRLIEPGVVVVIKDNDYASISEEIDKCKYFALAFCTVGKKISDKIAEYNSLGLMLEAEIFDKIANLSVLRVRKRADDIISKMIRTQFLGKTKRYTPGKNAPIEYQRVIMTETDASELFGATISDASYMIDPTKSVTFFYGCDQSLPLPAVIYDCDSCLRRDCEYCDAI